MPLSEEFWQEEYQRIFEMLLLIWTDAAWEGALAVMESMEEETSLGIDEALLWTAILGWIGSNIAEEVILILNATRAAVEAALAVWSGDPAELERLMEPIFGEARALTIGITEVITGLTIGGLLAWAAYGIMELVWWTAEDEKVCKICEPLHNTVIQIVNAILGERPPAHPRCRCKLKAILVLAGRTYLVSGVLDGLLKWSDNPWSDNGNSEIERVIEALAE